MSRRNPGLILVILVVIVSTMLGSSRTYAADTYEPYDAGASDLDFYISADGLGKSREEVSFATDILLGYGLLDVLSAYLGVTLAGDGYFANGAASIHFGLYGPLVDTDNFDLDLLFDSGMDFPGDGAFSVTPAIELNLDGDPNMLSWGLYVRAGVPVSGSAPPPDQEDGDPETTLSFEAVIGAYYMVLETHQILLEFDLSVPITGDDHAAELGGVTLGYNVAVHDTIELITQVFFDIPQDDEEFAVGVLVGFIATLAVGSQ